MLDLNQYVVEATEYLDQSPVVLFAIMVVILTLVIYLVKKLWRIALVSTCIVGAFMYIYNTNPSAKNGIDRNKTVALDEIKKKSEDLRRGVKQKYYQELPGLK